MSLFHVIVSCLAIFAVSSVEASEGSCKLAFESIPQYVVDVDIKCAEAVKKQINMELEASLKYLTMGAHFSQDTVNLPGFAKFFFDSASEEREHAVKLMKYLSMRGELNVVKDLIDFPVLKKFVWENGLKALEDSIELEVSVTNSIKNVINSCETPDGANKLSDYHISDWLTGEYLEEQYKSQRDLAGKISSLKKLKTTRESSAKDLADFIFDKNLLGIVV